MATKQRNVFSFYLAIFFSALPFLMGTRQTVDKDNLCREVDSLQGGSRNTNRGYTLWDFQIVPIIGGSKDVFGLNVNTGRVVFCQSAN